MGGAAQNTKLTITRSVLELDTPDFVCKFEIANIHKYCVCPKSRGVMGCSRAQQIKKTLTLKTRRRFLRLIFFSTAITPKACVGIGKQ